MLLISVKINQMGLKVDRGIDPDFAVKKERKARSTRELKIDNIPFSGVADRSLWGTEFTIASLQWFGTVDDPFAANEHEDIVGLLQMTWDAVFPDNKNDVTEYPAIKKIVRSHFSTHSNCLLPHSISIY
jgi:hypothetical protein